MRRRAPPCGLSPDVAGAPARRTQLTPCPAAETGAATTAAVTQTLTVTYVGGDFCPAANVYRSASVAFVCNKTVRLRCPACTGGSSQARTRRIGTSPRSPPARPPHGSADARVRAPRSLTQLDSVFFVFEAPPCTYQFQWTTPAACPNATCANTDAFGPACEYLCAECALHGTCLPGVNGNCTCNPGFANSTCSVCAPDHYGPNCTSCSTCDYGVCTPGMNGTCACANAWEGPQCDVCDVGFGADCTACALCQNGVCTPGVNGTCACVNAWEGPTCATCTAGFGANCTACASCLNGVCVPGVAGTCTCQYNWAGDLCNQCAPGRYGATCADCAVCDVHGTCVPGITGTCVCDDGWTGAKCDVGTSDGTNPLRSALAGSQKR